MSDVFELRTTDAAGRIGDLSVPRADRVVETPALLPVINPNIETVDPGRFREEFGAEMLITNSYIIKGNDRLRERARSEGVHEMLDFDGVVMTDSGSFQLAEYGEIDVTTEEILAFQREIGSDVATPVDVPTPPEASRETVEADLATTEERLEVAAEFDAGEMLVTAPVQGGVYPGVRERAARTAADLDLDVYPLGAVVPLLNEYRYADVVDVVAAAKRGLGVDAPVHLFGAGHPMMFALAVALGCDLFDSAAYAIYARDDRYLTVRGTEHVGDMTTFPCSCPVCLGHDPESIVALPDREREERLATHNLHVSFEEMRRIRAAIRSGDLLELVEARARSHPALLDGYRALCDHADQLEREDRVSKGTFEYLSAESARRPEVGRHHHRLDRVAVPDRLLLTEGPEFDRYEVAWRVVPPFGPVPSDLAQTYPLTAETPDRVDRAAQVAAAKGVATLVDANPAAEVGLAHRGWHEEALGVLPDGVDVVDLSTVGSAGAGAGVDVDGSGGGRRDSNSNRDDESEDENASTTDR